MLHGKTLHVVLDLSLAGFCLLSSNSLGGDDIRVRTRDRDKDGKPDVFIRETLRSGKVIKAEMEADADGDGKTDMTYVKVFHNGKMVFFESWDKKSNQNARMYCRAGKDLVAEVDENNDGIFDLIILFDETGDVRTVLNRSAAGKIEFAADERATTVKESFGLSGAFAEAVKELRPKDAKPGKGTTARVKP